MKKKETQFMTIARMLTDPARPARLAIQEAERELLWDRVRQELAPLVRELRAAGVEVGDLLELRRDAGNLKAAFPILLPHLERTYSHHALSKIAYAFETPDARPFLDAIVSIFENTIDDPDKPSWTSWRQRLGYAVAAIVMKSDFPLLERLMRNPKLTSHRIALVRPVIKFGRDKGWAILESLANDPDLSTEIAIRLSEKARRERAKLRRKRPSESA